jgi:cob(I)alamin adenosyltransferase
MKSLLYTKTGDKGTTALVGGSRVSKNSPRIESYGTTDELNAFIALLMAEPLEEADTNFLRYIQQKMFTVGSYLATDTEQTELRIESHVTSGTIARIEKEIDAIDATLPKIKSFILPGGSRAAALAHVCRTVCRRAERRIYSLHETAPVEANVLIFINRLSDYFFVLSRKLCLAGNGREIIWEHTCD